MHAAFWQWSSCKGQIPQVHMQLLARFAVFTSNKASRIPERINHMSFYDCLPGPQER